MILIGKDKLAEYIKKQPEAEAHVLLWLKEFGIMERKSYDEALRFFNSTEYGFKSLGFGTSTRQLGMSDHRISTMRSTKYKLILLNLLVPLKNLKRCGQKN